MKYPLLPYSQLVFDMLKTNPEVYYSRFSLRLNPYVVDIARLKYAIKTALRNHPVFSMQIDKEGMQEYSPSTDILHGQYHTIDFFKEGENVRMDVVYNRILGDATSERIILEDVCRAHQNLPLLSDNYLDYLMQVGQSRKSTRYSSDKQWLEDEFGNLTQPVHPQTDVPINENINPIEAELWEDYSYCRDAINSLQHEEVLPMTAFFSLACALAIMEYNGTDKAALTWAYGGRETQEEQRIYGSLHRDIPFKINRMSKIELIRAARKQYREGIAHSGYPFTLTKPYTAIWNYALNVLSQPAKKNINIPFPFDMVESCNYPKVAYALLDVEIYDEEQLYINFRYSATHYKPESIRRFAALVRKYVEWLVE